MEWAFVIALFLLGAASGGGALPEGSAPPTSNAAADTASNKLWLINGDVLQGNLLGWVSTNAVLWKHPDMHDPISIPLARIAMIRLTETNATAELPTADKWQIKLINGDCFPGEIVALDDERLALKTSYAGQLNLSRPAIRSISLVTTNAPSNDTPTNGTIVLMINGDQVSGKLLAIKNGAIDFETTYAPVKIPLEKVQFIGLSRPSSARLPRGADTLIANLANNGLVSLAIEQWDQTGVTATSPNFGRARFATTAFRSLQLTPTRHLQVRIFEDGADRLHVQGQRVWLTHESWKFPGESDDGTSQTTLLNGEAWSPEWQDNRSTDYQLPEAPVPEGGALQAKLEIIKARGHVTITQQPTDANNYETVVLIDDADIPAQDWYEFLIDWSAGD